MGLARLATVAAAAVATAIAVAACAGDAYVIDQAAALGPQTEALRGLRGWMPTRGVTMRLTNGDLAGYVGERSRIALRLDEIPPRLVQAFVSAEDKTFRDNPGIDVAAIVRSATRNLTAGTSRRPAGASTIAQQMVKNALLDGGGNTIRYKVRQAILALRAVRDLGRDEVLRIYLNSVYLGRNAEGVGDGARRMFGRDASSLSLEQEALMAGMTRFPTGYDPWRHPDAARARRSYVLDRMAEDGAITTAERDRAAAAPLGVLAAPAYASDAVLSEEEDGLGWALDVARKEARRLPSPASVGNVTLTIDHGLQSATQRALERGLMRWDAHRRGWRGLVRRPGRDAAATPPEMPPECATDCPAWTGLATVAAASATAVTVLDGAGAAHRVEPRGFAWIANGDARRAAAQLRPGDVVLAGDAGDGWSLAQPTEVNGSAVAVSAADGSVLAISGGIRWTPGAFDRATDSLRPPGSTFKPFVYATALQQGYRAGTTVVDEPVSIPQGRNSPPWEPQNDDGRFRGAMRLDQALASSRNTVAAQTMQDVGMDRVGDLAKSFGIYERILTPSAALGTQETTTLAMTTAYATLAAGGIHSEPTILRDIRDAKGRTLPEWSPPSRVQTLETDIADAMSAMLTKVVAPGGTARSLAPFAIGMTRRGMPVSAKTGTSQSYKDAWIIGYAGGIAVGVRIGYDTPRTLGPDGFGATVAGPVFEEIMRAASANGVAQARLARPPRDKMDQPAERTAATNDAAPPDGASMPAPDGEMDAPEE